MAALWRGVKGWVADKSPELERRQALISAIQSGEEEEAVVAIALARQECVQWKGRAALSHDEMSSKLHRYLTVPLPKENTPPPAPAPLSRGDAAASRIGGAAGSIAVADGGGGSSGGGRGRGAEEAGLLPMTPDALAERLGHGAVARRLRREAEKYRTVSRQMEDVKKKAAAHRGRSTSERADLARARLQEARRRGAAAPAEAS